MLAEFWADPWAFLYDPNNRAIVAMAFAAFRSRSRAAPPARSAPWQFSTTNDLHVPGRLPTDRRVRDRRRELLLTKGAAHKERLAEASPGLDGEPTTLER